MQEDDTLDALGERKAALRSAVLARRAAVPAAERAAASTAIREALEALPELVGCRAVLGYASFGSEVELDPWLAARIGDGWGVLLPFVAGEELGITRVFDLESDLVPGWRGVREPRASGRRPARPDRVDAVVTPGVAFDRACGRLGYGGGFFDRLLARLRPGTPVIGVAFEVQVVEEVPRGPHDLGVDAVVTEAAVYRCPKVP